MKKVLFASGAGGGNGVPVRNGLVAEYKFDECRNLLKYSQQFDNAAWTKTRSTVTPNSIAAPDGTMTAGTLIESNDAATSHYVGQTAASLFNGKIVTYSVYAKAGNRRYFRMSTPGGKYCQFDLVNGVAGVDIYGCTPSIVFVEDGWYRCSLASVAEGEASGLNIMLTTGLTGDSRNFNGDPVTYPVGIYIWGAQFEGNPNTTVYVPTTDKQTLTDYSGNANHGTLGSTAGADTNDPKWTGEGAYFTTDDYISAPRSTTTVFTAIIACEQETNSQVGIFGIGAIITGDKGVALEHLAGHNWHVGATGVTRSAALAGKYTGDNVFVVKRNGLTLSLFNAATPSDFVSYVGGVIIDDATTTIIGARNAGSFMVGSVYYLVIYNRILTQAEITKNYAYLKSYLKKQRGISLA